MKKIVLSLCLLYAANSCAMNRASFWAGVIVLGTVPVTFPALINYPIRKVDPFFDSFLKNATLGAMPVTNVVLLSKKAKDDGFLSGMSLYATLPVAYKVLSFANKVK